MAYGVAPGRRFRALTLWMVLRTFGTAGVAERLRYRCERARAFGAWVAEEPGWELAAPVSLSLVCFRCAPAELDGEAQDALTARARGRERDGRGVPVAHEARPGRR